MIIDFDSYHRSGSHFFISSFLTTFPDCEVNWGQHNMATLSIYGAVTVVRNPVDAVASRLHQYFGGFDPLDAQECILENLAWMNKTSKNMESLYVIDFIALTSSPSQVMSEAGQRFGLTPRTISSQEIIRNLTPVDDTPANYIPSESRSVVVKRIRDQVLAMQSAELALATETYHGIVNA